MKRVDRAEYRAAFDAVKFSGDFEEKTINQLTQAVRQTEKEERMILKHPKRILIAAVALVAVLALSVSAFTIWLSPKEVAEQMQDPLLAAAFDSPEAVTVNKTVESEGYTFTLAGMVSGKELSAFQDVDTDRTYVVASLGHTDGSPMDPNSANFVFSPLVSGYEPWRVNGWTLGGGFSSFVKDGVLYYLFDCQNLEPFADHTVYLAAYEGNAPSRETFDYQEDGSIAFVSNYEGPHALFTLPLDAALANPAAAAQILEGTM